jgi:hypothetical protein
MEGITTGRAVKKGSGRERQPGDPRLFKWPFEHLPTLHSVNNSYERGVQVLVVLSRLAPEDGVLGLTGPRDRPRVFGLGGRC